MQESKYSKKEKELKERADKIIYLLTALDLDNVEFIYRNKNHITNEELFRKNICELINYMFELSDKLKCAEQNVEIYKMFYEKEKERNKSKKIFLRRKK